MQAKVAAAEEESADLRTCREREVASSVTGPRSRPEDSVSAMSQMSQVENRQAGSRTASDREEVREEMMCAIARKRNK